jgi:hypothetical protein
VFPWLTVQVGTGTDGAGTVLVGATAAPSAISVVSTSADPVTSALFVTYDGDGFVLVHAPTANNSNLRCILAVDRQRTATGAAVPNSGWPDSGFIRLYRAGSGGTSNTLIVDPVSETTATFNRITASAGRPISVSTSMVNAADEMTMFPVLAPGRQGLYTSKMLLAYPAIDATYDTNIATPHLGATRTYKALGSFVGYADVQNNIGTSLAFWWSD